MNRSSNDCFMSTSARAALQVPAYLAKQSELKAKGISEVIVYCVNDMAVMEAWAKDQVRYCDYCESCQAIVCAHKKIVYSPATARASRDRCSSSWATLPPPSPKRLASSSPTPDPRASSAPAGEFHCLVPI